MKRRGFKVRISRSTTPNPDLTRDEVSSSSGPDLSALRRLDPLIEEIMAVASHAVSYQLDSSGIRWCLMNVEGSFSVVKRNAPERYHFIIMNTINTENLVEDILQIQEYDVILPNLTYKNKDNLSRCILFDTPEICEDICNVLHWISTAYGKASPKLKLSYKSELEVPVVDPISDATKGLSSMSAVGSATDNSLPPLLFLNQGTTAVTNQGTVASSTSAVRLQDLQFGPLNLQKMLYRPRPPTGFPPLSFALHQNFPVGPTDVYSSMNFTPRTVDSVISSSHYGPSLPAAPLPPLNPFYPSIPNLNLSQNLSNAPSVSKEKIHEVLVRLIMNDSFVDMVYQEMLRMQ